MKKITLILLLISFVGYSQTTLLDFESATTWTDFDGGVVTTIANPYNNSDNNSANVGQMVKSAGQTWGGSWTQLSSSIDFANNNTLTLKVYSPRVGAKVLLKVKNASDANIKFEKEVLTTKANEWETLTFDYSAINTSNTYEKVILIFDNGTMGDGTSDFTFLIDDLILSNSGGSGSTVSIPLDFETATTWVDFDGGVLTTVTNPHNNSGNNSANVGKMVKNSGQVWGGSSLVLSSAMDFNSNNTFTLKVYSPRVGAKALLKVENSGDANVNFEKEVLTTKASEWETLTFDYSSIDTAHNYDKVILIFDNGTMGDGTANFTFYIDDIALSNTGGSNLTQMDLPVSFEDSTVDYGVIGFGNATSTIVANPNVSGDNTSSTVVKVVKEANAETWAGTTVTAAAELGFITAIPFSNSDSKMTVAVWSPDSGIQVRLKAEDHADNTHTVETEVTTTKSNEWEILEFDFSNQATGTESLSHGLSNGWKYDKVSIFFNFGVDGATAGAKTYYFDNMTFGDLASLSVKNESLIQINTYPNPVTNTLKINSNSNIENIVIFNILGNKVLEKNLTKKDLIINVSNLNSGIYILQFKTENGIGSKKFVKK